MTNEMSVAEAMAKAREYDKKHEDMPSVSRTLSDEVDRLRQLLKPHFCLCQERKTDPSAHGEQCPYRTLTEGGK